MSRTCTSCGSAQTNDPTGLCAACKITARAAGEHIPAATARRGAQRIGALVSCDACDLRFPPADITHYNGHKYCPGCLDLEREGSAPERSAKCDKCSVRVIPASALIEHHGQALCAGCYEKLATEAIEHHEAAAETIEAETCEHCGEAARGLMEYQGLMLCPPCRRMEAGEDVGDEQEITELPHDGNPVGAEPQHDPARLEKLANQKARDGGSTQPPQGGESQMVKKTTGKRAKKKLGTRKCTDCQKEYQPTGTTQKLCAECKAKAKPPKKVKAPKAPRTPKPAASRQKPSVAPEPSKSTNHRPGPSHDALGLSLVIHVNRDGNAYCARIGGDLQESFSGCGDTILDAVKGALDEFRASI